MQETKADATESSLLLLLLLLTGIVIRANVFEYVLCAKHCFDHIACMFNAYTHSELGTAIIPILQMKKLT